MLEIVPTFVRGEEIADVADGLEQLVEGAGSCSAEEGLEFGERHLDRVQVGTVAAG